MITAKALYASARLRSLPLSVSGVLLGSGAAYGVGAFRADIFALALLTTLLFQALSDYANDYGDAVKGTDDGGRLGPRRAIQTGQMSAEQMKRVIVATSLLSAFSSLALSVLAFGGRFYLVALFLALGGASIYAAIRYTVGAGAYGYKGLGDVFVFLFFGLLSVLGSYFLYAHSLDAALLLPACACGMLSTAVLNLNNMRDIQNDALKGKRTIPVRIGLRAAKRYHVALITGAMCAMLAYSLLRGDSGIRLLYIASFAPLIWHLFFVLKVLECRDFDGQLKVVALCTFAMSALFFVGEILG
ncbi:1,4-dihydroxy-2-naphthoate octaprenyltransferase [uncultured Campylobacter sp.]|uniref:1,4-dihydroxy-2-naphthoate octaprenyltransferase n=1 Tax=uncultured Campylobacter sp. TaxID=218934 RepID=UPI00261A451B|nr:1,4-dihydroxy-2-naphthoate octaprenyltransferase [uncultured Campylobacter sp.]